MLKVQRARAWFQQALNVWRELQHAGALRAGETSEPDRIAAKIKEADAALGVR